MGVKLYEAIAQIEEIDKGMIRACESRWDKLCKPLNSLGRLEEYVSRLAGIYRTLTPKVEKKAVLIMAADNGVVSEGVTQTGSEVTAQVVRNMAKGKSTINILSKVASAEVIPIDIGILEDVEEYNVIKYKIRKGTDNIINGPAMTREEAIKAIEVGIKVVGELKDQYDLFITGEMGIGNTTTSSAIASVMLDTSVETVTGRGAGLSTEGLKRKIQVIKTALEVNKPLKEDPIDVLAKVGGFDIAGLVGCYLGAALYKKPIIMDGFITTIAALIAVQLQPKCKDYIFGSHVSKEPAGRMLLETLNIEGALDLSMGMGEGTGAIIASNLFDYALKAYYEIPSFDDALIEEYTHQI